MDEKPADKTPDKAAEKTIETSIPDWLKKPGEKVRFFNRGKGKLLLEVFLGLVVLFMLAVSVLFWRISRSPLDVAFVKPYIETALSNDERGFHASLGKVILHWPDFRGPVLLNVQSAKVTGADKKTIVDIDKVSITLSKAGLLIGRIQPVGLILKGPELTLIRAKDGTFDVGFGEPGKAGSVDSQTDLTERILDHIARPGNESGSPLAALKLFEIQDAQVNVEDYKSGTSSYLPNVNVVFRSTDEGLDSDMHISFNDTPEWPSYLRASIMIPWKTKDVVVDATLRNFDLAYLSDKIPALSILDGQEMEIDGQLYAVLDANFRPQYAQLSEGSTSGEFNIPEFSEESLPYSDFNFELFYNAATGRMDLKNTTITAKDVTINAEAALEATDNSISGPSPFSIAELEQAQIKPLWPKALEGDNAQEWIVHRLSKGTFHNVSAVIDLFAVRGPEGWDYGAQDAHAEFSFEDMTVHYRDPLLPAEKAKGKGTFDLAEEKLSINISEGAIADLKVESADLEFVNIIESGKGKADLRIKIAGPLASGFRYLTLEPIALKHGFDLEKVKGNAAATVNINFPAHKDIKVEDVKVNAEGVMSDVTLPGVMKALTLTGGPLDFTVKDNQFRLKGEAKIDGQAAMLDYREFLNSEGQEYKSKIVAKLTVTEEMRRKVGIDLSDFMSGDAGVDAVYTEYAGGKADADLNVDLSPASVFFKPFGYSKAPGIEGSAVLKASLQDDALRTVSGLTATAPGMEIKDASFTFAGKDSKLTGGKMPNLAVGETVGRVDFDVNDAGVYAINLSGSFLDLRPFMENDADVVEAYTEPPMKITVKTDRMRAADGDTISHADLFVDIDGEGHFNTLELTGTAGKSDFFIRYKPDETGARVFRMGSKDAGGVLRAFGVYENIVGGELAIKADPVKGINDRNVRGVAEITNFRVVRAPTLARLLGMLSLPGVLSVLKDEGLGFAKLEAKFDWLYKPSGSILVMKDGRTSGNSVGFTFDGTYNKNKGTIDVEGTMIPLAGVNKVIGNIPLVGDILTGGSGGVFAATYSVKGEAKSPNVFVNPLSVLTPGILRRILFEQN